MEMLVVATDPGEQREQPKQWINIDQPVDEASNSAVDWPGKKNVPARQQWWSSHVIMSGHHRRWKVSCEPLTYQSPILQVTHKPTCEPTNINQKQTTKQNGQYSLVPEKRHQQNQYSPKWVLLDSPGWFESPLVCWTLRPFACNAHRRSLDLSATGNHPGTR